MSSLVKPIRRRPEIGTEFFVTLAVEVPELAEDKDVPLLGHGLHQLGQLVEVVRSGIALGRHMEGLQGVVDSFFRNLLGRPADGTGLGGFVTAMQQGVTDQQVVASIGGSDEFFANL